MNAVLVLEGFVAWSTNTACLPIESIYVFVRFIRKCHTLSLGIGINRAVGFQGQLWKFADYGWLLIKLLYTFAIIV